MSVASTAVVAEDVVQRWRLLPFARYSACSSCESDRDGDGRRIYVRGRRRNQLVCLFCFSSWPLRRQMPR